ncbi:hypothetical protein H4R27_003807 [Coemansia aciculifera]|nr:hypothetical protein H4R27_003807 [Coemansia aciculifera]
MAGGLYAPTKRATSNSVSENYTSPVTKAVFPASTSTRPVVAVRARNYAEQVPVAMEQGSDVYGERRSMKKFRSADTSRASAMAAATAPTVASERRAAAPPTGHIMRQQSETTVRRPLSRIAGRTMSSMAPPVRQAVRAPTRSDSVSGHNASSMAPRVTHGARPSSNRGSRNPSPAPGGDTRIPHVPLSPQAGGSYRGRRLVSPVEAQEGSRLPRLGAGGRWVSEGERQARELASLRDSESQLIEDVKQLNEVFVITKTELERERINVAEANERTRHVEAELGTERDNNAALMAKIKALEELLADRTAATDPAAERFEGREGLQDTMGSVLAACVARKPRSELSAAARRDINRVEAYVAGDVQPQHPSYAHEEMRASRRRSSMLFADLMLPSGGGHTMAGAGGPCERCEQLAETMQNLEADNDYYRDANRKLRDAVNDTTSRHNALVRIFEVERARRREIHAAGLAEASRAATHERAMLDAEEPLANRFAHSLHIAQPAS